MASSAYPSNRGRHRWALPVIITAVNLLTVGGAAGLLVPVPHDFSGAVTHYGCTGSGVGTTPDEVPSLHAFPAESSVTIHWNSANGGVVDFYVLSGGGGMIPDCTQSAPSGGCGFSANGGVYELTFSPQWTNWTVATVS